MLEHWQWPQYLQAFLYVVLIVLAPVMHGRPRTGNHNGFVTLAIVPFGIWVLHKGGFW